MIDPVKLREAVAYYRREQQHNGLPEAQCTILDAAEAYLATLPPLLDHVIVYRDKQSGEVALYNWMGQPLMSKETALERAATASKSYPHMIYTVVPVPT